MKLTYFDFGLGVTGMVPTSEAVHIYIYIQNEKQIHH